MLKHTKIVATVSDQRCDVAFVEALYKAGMNVVRLNTAHMMEEGLTRVVNNVRTVSDRIGILMDTKGPEVRTTTTVNKEPIPFKTGEIVKVIGNPDQETSHDCICVSYKNFVNDLDIQRILDERNSPIKIIAKIENQEGVDNIEEILEVAYGVMIARGDLGIEVPAEKIPGIQRMLIRKCVEVKKPVIVATQMLHSMINNPRPTRAEVTDIANAIYYRTDALMLSGETAYGKYPIEAVQTMTKVAREAEKTKLSANDIRVPIEGNDLDVTSFLAKQAVKSSSKLHVKAIITDSYTGRTARYLAAFRGTSTVFAICYNPRVMRMLGLSYGVWAVHQPYNDSRRGYFYDALNQLIHSGRITRNDMVAYLSGSFGEGGGTSFLEINNVGKVLDAGTPYQLPTFKE